VEVLWYSLPTVSIVSCSNILHIYAVIHTYLPKTPDQPNTIFQPFYRTAVHRYRTGTRLGHRPRTPRILLGCEWSHCTISDCCISFSRRAPQSLHAGCLASCPRNAYGPSQLCYICDQGEILCRRPKGWLILHSLFCWCGLGVLEALKTKRNVFIYVLTLQSFIHEQIDIKFKNIHIDEGIRLKVSSTGQESHIKTKPRKTITR
jgi:hypothetical protein